MKRFCLYLGWKTEVKPFFFWGQAPNSRSRQQSEPVASLASVLLTGSWTHSRQLPPLQPACFFLGFPGGSFSEESASSTVEPGSIPGWGRSPGGGNGNPLQYSCLGNPMYRRAGGLQAIELQSWTWLKWLSTRGRMSVEGLWESYIIFKTLVSSPT